MQQSTATAVLSPRLLTRCIQRACSCNELLCLYQKNREIIDDIHIVALFHRLAAGEGGGGGGLAAREGGAARSAARGTLPQQQQQQQPVDSSCTSEQGAAAEPASRLLLRELFIKTLGAVPCLRQRATSSILWSLSRLPRPRRHDRPAHDALVAALLLHASGDLGWSTFEPRQLCSIAAALVQLRPCALPCPQQQQQQQQQQRNATAAAADAAAGDGGGVALRSHSSQLDSAARLLAGGMGAHAHPPCWPAWALDGLFAALGDVLPHCGPHDIAQAIFCMAALRCKPPTGWLAAWMLRARALLPVMPPPGLANAAYGLVRVLQQSGELPVLQQQRQQYNRHRQQQQQQQQAPPQNVPPRNHSGGTAAAAAAAGRGGGGKLGSTSGSSVNNRPPLGDHQLNPKPTSNLNPNPSSNSSSLLPEARAWLTACARVAVLHADVLQPRELIGQLLWSVGAAGATLPQPAGAHLMRRVGALLPSCDARHTAAALHCAALLHDRPSESWLTACWRQASLQLGSASARDVAQLLSAAAQLQLQLPARLCSRLQSRAGELAVRDPSAGVSCLASVLALRLKPHRSLLLRVQSAAATRPRSCTPRDVALLLQLLADAGEEPVDVRCVFCVLQLFFAAAAAAAAIAIAAATAAADCLQHPPFATHAIYTTNTSYDCHQQHHPPPGLAPLTHSFYSPACLPAHPPQLG